MDQDILDTLVVSMVEAMVLLHTLVNDFLLLFHENARVLDLLPFEE